MDVDITLRKGNSGYGERLSLRLFQRVLVEVYQVFFQLLV